MGFFGENKEFSCFMDFSPPETQDAFMQCLSDFFHTSLQQFLNTLDEYDYYYFNLLFKNLQGIDNLAQVLVLGPYENPIFDLPTYFSRGCFAFYQPYILCHFTEGDKVVELPFLYFGLIDYNNSTFFVIKKPKGTFNNFAYVLEVYNFDLQGDNGDTSITKIGHFELN